MAKSIGSPTGSRAAWLDALRQDPMRQAFWIMRVGFVVLPPR